MRKNGAAGTAVKKKQVSFRLDGELYERLQAIKLRDAHRLVNDSDFYVEAIRIYVELAEQFTVDDHLTPRCDFSKLHDP